MGKKEQEIINYLKNNNGFNLRLVESNLVLCRDIETKKYKFGEISSEDPVLKNIYSILDNAPEPYFTNCDIYCFNEGDNAFVVIEVKTGEADHKAFGQILYYLINAEVIEFVNGKEVKKLRGIVLARKIDGTLKTLVKAYNNKIPEISLKEYCWNKEEKLIIKEPP